MLLFEERLDAARAERDSGDDAAALRVYEAALGLWRGGVLQDVPASVVWDPAITRIEGLRSVAVDECLEVRLRLGDYASLVADLRSRLTENPLREDLWRMVVQALHDSGRTDRSPFRVRGGGADHRRRTRHRAERTAARRGRGGQRLRRAGAVRPRLAPVCQLPMDVPDFTGRAEEIAALERLLSAAGRQPVVAIVSGPPGSGKSTLAVHVAHRVRDAFPDGQLFVDLGGTSDQPREPADVLAEMLRGLGVIDSTIPGELSERAALLRSRLAQRRFLIVLDDAAGSAQVRPLLPGHRRLGGARQLTPPDAGAARVPARPSGVMNRDDARALFGAVVGPDRLMPRCGRTSTGCSPAAARCRWPYGSRAPGWRTVPAGPSARWPTSCTTSAGGWTSSRRARWRYGRARS